MKQGIGSTGSAVVLGHQIWRLEAEVRRRPVGMTSDGGVGQSEQLDGPWWRTVVAGSRGRREG
jgi:hypothetical protein